MMNQIKIGKFIAECRRKENITRAQLAKKLNITDMAVSKCETRDSHNSGNETRTHAYLACHRS